LLIGFQDTVENVGDVFFGTQCTFSNCFYMLLCFGQINDAADADVGMSSSDLRLYSGHRRPRSVENIEARPARLSPAHSPLVLNNARSASASAPRFTPVDDYRRSLPRGVGHHPVSPVHQATTWTSPTPAGEQCFFRPTRSGFLLGGSFGFPVIFGKMCHSLFFFLKR